MKTLYSFTGILIFMSFILGLLSFFTCKECYVVAGVLAWGAGVPLFLTIPKEKWLLSMILLGLGIGCFGIAYVNGFSIDLAKAFSVNQILLMLLIAVNYLKLVAIPKNETIETLPQGKKSFVMTYFGVHLFGSIINLSAIFLVLDRLMKQGALRKVQLASLTRAFSTDALWSPFFVAFAAVMVYAPNASIMGIWSVGFPLVFIAFILTWWELRGEALDTFTGYPLRFSTLLVPLLLAFFVALSHWWWPWMKVIVLVSLFSFVVTIVLLPLREGLRQAFLTLARHTQVELPKMKMELTLFLVAGFFGAGVSTLLDGYSVALPFKEYDPLVASLVLLGMIGVSFIGIHPVISIAVLGGWLQNMSVDHTLLAITFLIAWSISICSSPVSGLNLAIAGRYNIKTMQMFAWNVPYALKLYVVAVVLLFLLF